MNEKKKFVHINVPETLLREFDRTFWGKYQNRTAALHEAMRRFIKEVSNE